MVELHAHRAPDLADRQRLVEAAVLDAQVVEKAEGLASEVPSSGCARLASSSVMTTTGSTTSCSSNRSTESGSASRTLVSRTNVR